jgi:hypothetical protein
MPQFQGIPPIPIEGLPQWQYDALAAIKENLEILMGTRGPGRAVTNDAIGIEPQDWQQMTQIASRGDYYAITTGSGTFNMPTIGDYTLLLNDVQQLATDVATIQSVLVALLGNMRQ